MVSKALAKKLLIPLVIISVLIGSIILGFGIWNFTSIESHPYGSSDYPVLLTAMMIGVGGLVTLLATLFGYRAISNPSSKLITYYIFLMAIMVISQIILVSINYKWKADAVFDIKTSLYDYLKTYDPTENQEDLWNKFQKKKKCCGVKGEFNLTDVGIKVNDSQLLEIPKDPNEKTCKPKRNPKCKYSSREVWYHPTKSYPNYPNPDLDNKDYHQQKYHEQYCHFKVTKGKNGEKDKYIFDGKETKYKEVCELENELHLEARYRGYENWKSAETWQTKLGEMGDGPWSTKSVPKSCCKEEFMDLQNCGLLKTNYTTDEYKAWKGKINKMGCYYVYYKEVKGNIGIGHLGGIVIFILELISFSIICSLLKQIDPPKHH